MDPPAAAQIQDYPGLPGRFPHINKLRDPQEHKNAKAVGVEIIVNFPPWVLPDDPAENARLKKKGMYVFDLCGNIYPDEMFRHETTYAGVKVCVQTLRLTGGRSHQLMVDFVHELKKFTGYCDLDNQAETRVNGKPVYPASFSHFRVAYNDDKPKRLINNTMKEREEAGDARWTIAAQYELRRKDGPNLPVLKTMDWLASDVLFKYYVNPLDVQEEPKEKVDFWRKLRTTLFRHWKTTLKLTCELAEEEEEEVKQVVVKPAKKGKGGTAEGKPLRELLAELLLQEDGMEQLSGMLSREDVLGLITARLGNDAGSARIYRVESGIVAPPAPPKKAEPFPTMQGFMWTKNGETLIPNRTLPPPPSKDPLERHLELTCGVQVSDQEPFRLKEMVEHELYKLEGRRLEKEAAARMREGKRGIETKTENPELSTFQHRVKKFVEPLLYGKAFNKRLAEHRKENPKECRATSLCNAAMLYERELFTEFARREAKGKHRAINAAAAKEAAHKAERRRLREQEGGCAADTSDLSGDEGRGRRRGKKGDKRGRSGSPTVGCGDPGLDAFFGMPVGEDDSHRVERRGGRAVVCVQDGEWVEEWPM